MCEIFGFTSNKEEIINNYLKEFFSHCDYHPHGWGIANIKNNKIMLEKEPKKAVDSELLLEKLKNPIKTKDLLAHIRYATMGCTNDKNCHPFIKKDNDDMPWVLIHNGTVFQCKKLNKYMKQQKGDTDSERILFHIINEINKQELEKQRVLTDLEKFNIIDKVIAKITKNNKINLILHNGELMYVHTNLKDTLHYQQNENHIIFSTLPLNDGEWKHVPLNTLLAYKDGKLVYKGKKHENEYIETEADLEFLAKLEEEMKNNPCGLHSCQIK